MTCAARPCIIGVNKSEKRGQMSNETAFSVHDFEYTEDVENMPNKPVLMFLVDSAAYDWALSYHQMPVAVTHGDTREELEKWRNMKYNRFICTTDLLFADYKLLNTCIIAICHEKWRGNLETVYMWKTEDGYCRTSQVKENESDVLLDSICNGDIWRRSC